MDLPSFWKSEAQLLDVSLIQKTAGTGQLSIHRLVQVEFQYSLAPQERQSAFENTTTLLSLVFPKQIKGQVMHSVWGQCQLYYAHIISLAHHYMQEDEELSSLKPNLEFCEVVSNCAWYLRERSALELDSLLEAGLGACRKIMSEPGVELVYAHLCNTASAWDDDRGFFQRAEPRFLECLTIRRKYLDPHDDELSGALHNISLNYLMSMKLAKLLPQEYDPDHYQIRDYSYISNLTL